MCAGVQNVSLPIVWCHEMSHNTPSGMHAAPRTTAKQYHGSHGLFVVVALDTSTTSPGVIVWLEPFIRLVIHAQEDGSKKKPVTRRCYLGSVTCPRNRQAPVGLC